MDTAQWPQEIVVKPIEEIVVTNKCPRPLPQAAAVDHHQRKPRPEKEQALNCPRCHSTNTKFCYYNNYSLTQPRYFCKTCRRYWTEGGSLRNIPVGGGSRKNKRSSYNSSYNSSSIVIPPPPPPPPKNIKLSIIPDNNNNNGNDNITPPNKVHDEGQDLNLSFPSSISELLVQQNNNNNNTVVASASSASSSSSTTTTTTTSHHHNNHNNFSALELITGITTTTTTSRGLINNTSTNTFMPVPSSSVLATTHDDPNIGYTFPLLLQHDFKPTSSLNFSLDGGSTVGFGSLQDTTSGGRIFFPFEDLKHVSSTTTMDHQNNNNKEQQQEDHSTGGYWTASSSLHDQAKVGSLQNEAYFIRQASRTT